MRNLYEKPGGPRRVEFSLFRSKKQRQTGSQPELPSMPKVETDSEFHRGPKKRGRPVTPIVSHSQMPNAPIFIKGIIGRGEIMSADTGENLVHSDPNLTILYYEDDDDPNKLRTEIKYTKDVKDENRQRK